MLKKIYILTTIIGCLLSASSSVRAATIDFMGFNHFDYYRPNIPFDSLKLGGSPDKFILSDGTSFDSGAGYFGFARLEVDHIERNNGIINYFLNWTNANNLLFDIINYSSSYVDQTLVSYNTQFALRGISPFVLSAREGTTKAYLIGISELISEEKAPNGNLEDYYPLTADVGAFVPFLFQYELTDGFGLGYGYKKWDEKTFDNLFYYNVTGGVYFKPVPIPGAIWLFSSGLTCLIAMRRRMARNSV